MVSHSVIVLLDKDDPPHSSGLLGPFALTPKLVALRCGSLSEVQLVLLCPGVGIRCFSQESWLQSVGGQCLETKAPMLPGVALQTLSSQGEGVGVAVESLAWPRGPGLLWARPVPLPGACTCCCRRLPRHWGACRNPGAPWVVRFLSFLEPGQVCGKSSTWQGLPHIARGSARSAVQQECGPAGAQWASAL